MLKTILYWTMTWKYWRFLHVRCGKHIPDNRVQNEKKHGHHCFNRVFERGFKLKETGVSSVQRDPDEKYSCGRSREIIRSSGADGTEREASNFVRNQMSLMPWTLFSQVPRPITRLFRSMCLRCNNSPGRNLEGVFVFSSTPANHQTLPRNVPVVK